MQAGGGEPGTFWIDTIRVVAVLLIQVAILLAYWWRRWKIRWRAKQLGHGFEQGRREAQRKDKQ